MQIKNILVIRFRRIGDSVLAMAIYASLRQTFPDANIDFILNDSIAHLYKGHPSIDRAITFTDEENKNIFKYTNKVRKVMKNTDYDIIIDMRSTLRTLLFSIFSLGTPYRIGTKKWYSHFIHNYRIDNLRDKVQDRVTQNLLLLTPLEKLKEVNYIKEFKLYITEKEKSDFRYYMENKGIDFTRPVVVAAVAARLAHKVWDKERMKEVLLKMIRKYNTQVVFNYAGAEEEEYAVNLYQMIGSDPNVFIDIKANSLRELCALCANSDFFFGNEGGPRHISQAFGVPSYAIYPPGINKCTWLPGDQTIYKGISPDDIMPAEQQSGMSYTEKFNLITVDRVWKELDESLSVYLKKFQPEK